MADPNTPLDDDTIASSRIAVVCDRKTKSTYSFDKARRLGCTTLVRADCVTHRGIRSICSGKVISEEKRQRFLQSEGGALRILHAHPHPHLARLVTCLDPTIEGGPSYLVIPKFGDNLHSVVRRKKGLAEGVAQRYFAQIVSAVAHCHRHNIVLRDIKLGKIFFSNSERRHVVFADLDGAQVLSSESSLLSDQRGSPAYVSPEVLTCKPYDGFKADTWALGVVLYVLLTGSYPFQDSRPAKLFNKIQQGWRGVKFPEKVSAPARRLICRLLCCQPDLRLSASDALACQWVEEGLRDESESNARGKLVSLRAIETDQASCDDQLVPEWKETDASPLLIRRVATSVNETIPKLTPLVLTRTTSSGSLSSSANSAASSPVSPMSGSQLLQMWPRLGMVLAPQAQPSGKPSDGVKRLREIDDSGEKSSRVKLSDWSAPSIEAPSSRITA